MNFEEVGMHLDRAWYEFFTYLSEQGFDVDKMYLNMDCKDVFSAVIDCAMEAAPEEGNNE